MKKWVLNIKKAIKKMRKIIKMKNLKKGKKDHTMKEEMIEPMNKQEINTIEITREIMIIKEIEAIEMIIDTETEKETGIEKETETEIEKWTNRRGNISQVKKTIEMIDISKEKKEATPLIDHIMTITNLTFQIQEITRSA